MNDYGIRRDPFAVLRTTTSPAEAAWAVAELTRCGFTRAEQIAADFGWRRSARGHLS